MNSESQNNIKTFTTSNGTTTEVYVPDTVTPATKILVYEHGSGGYYRDWKVFLQKFNEQNCDTIVIQASRDDFTTIDLIKKTLTDYNLSPNNVSFNGYSAGGICAVKDSIDLIETYKDTVQAPIISMSDGYICYGGPNKEQIKTLKDSNAVVVAFAQSPNYQVDSYKTLAKEGVNVLLAVDENVDLSHSTRKHAAMNANFILEGVMEFITGQKDLPSGYKLMTYNPTSNNFEPISSDYITDTNSLYELFDINVFQLKKERLTTLTAYDIKSDNNILSDYINNIRTSIKNSNFLNTTFSTSGCISTTNVPSKIQNCVENYFSSTTDILLKIVTLTDSISNIHSSYEKADADLTSNVDKIDVKI
ncbi:MAG: hypothetical protein PUC82_02945 [bacterium]|nr:hypothetical protein [bacterium]